MEVTFYDIYGQKDDICHASGQHNGTNISLKV